VIQALFSRNDMTASMSGIWYSMYDIYYIESNIRDIMYLTKVTASLKIQLPNKKAESHGSLIRRSDLH
jgi:hypothetical protein